MHNKTEVFNIPHLFITPMRVTISLMLALFILIPTLSVTSDSSNVETWDDARHKKDSGTVGGISVSLSNDSSDQNIIIGEGIDALLGYLVRLFIQAGDNVVTSNGSYPTFNYHVEGFGGQLFKCDYRDDKEDLQLLIDKASKTKAKLLYFSNPNNPMGTWMRGDKIVSLLEKLPDD